MISREDFYNNLSEDEKQLCDLCDDWQLGDCEECELCSNIIKQREGNDYCKL